MSKEWVLDILYEDADCFFVNKQAGISVHADGKTPETTLADLVLEKYPELAAVGEPIIVLKPHCASSRQRNLRSYPRRQKQASLRIFEKTIPRT